MDEALSLPVTYKGQELEFPLRIAAQGFLTRYVVLVDTIEVVIEHDDQGELRAIIYGQEERVQKFPEPGLLEAITAILRRLVS